MNFEEYRKHDAVGLAGLVSKGEVSPSELLETAVARMAAVNPKINAVTMDLTEWGRQDVKRDIRMFQQACRARGVDIARPFPPLMTWARITIGTMAEMEHAVEALRGALAEPSPTASVWPDLVPYVPRRDGSWFC